jgi:hypothetical protein
MWQFLITLNFSIQSQIDNSFVSNLQGDTVILRKKTSQNGKLNNIVYIEPNKKAWQYDSLQSFFSESPNSSSLLFPYGGWIELVLYNSKYHLYYPCDLSNLYKLYISSDKTKGYGAEFEESQITSIHTLRKNAFSITANDQQLRNKTFHIYLIDKTKGIAIKENLGVKGETRYQLLLAASKTKYYPLIVNYCDSKASEFKFQKIDFESLLRRFNKQ